MYRRENARVLGRMYMANFVKGSDSENTGLVSECMRGSDKTYKNRRSYVEQTSPYVVRLPFVSCTLIHDGYRVAAR